MKICLTLIATAIAAPLAAAPLAVNVDGVQAGGDLYVSVQTRDEFMQQGGTASERVEDVTGGSHAFNFDVPPGEYAVSIWHDDNQNRRFDMAENGMPEDGWAMVNGDELRGEPQFDAVKTVVDADGATVSMTLIYSADLEARGRD